MSTEQVALWAAISANLATSLWTLLRACQTWHKVKHLRDRLDTK